MQRRNLIKRIEHQWYLVGVDEKLDLLEIDYLQGILKNDPMEEIRKKLREITPAFAEYVKIKGKRYKRDNVTVGCLIF